VVSGGLVRFPVALARACGSPAGRSLAFGPALISAPSTPGQGGLERYADRDRLAPRAFAGLLPGGPFACL